MTLKEQAIQLYKTAFPTDSDEFINSLFSKYFNDNLFYLLLDGKVVSMLFLIPCELKMFEQKYPAAYLYAAATLPQYRGQGLMTKLINRIKKETVENGVALITKPANKGLYDYYAKFGFKTAFYQGNNDALKPLENSLEITAKKYIEIREALLKNTPHILLSDMDFALSGLKFFGNEKFCVAADSFEGSLNVKEFLTEDFDINGANNPFAMMICPKGIHFPEKMHFGPAMD